MGEMTKGLVMVFLLTATVVAGGVYFYFASGTSGQGKDRTSKQLFVESFDLPNQGIDFFRSQLAAYLGMRRRPLAMMLRRSSAEARSVLSEIREGPPK
jgi:hypothetical protein